MKLYTQSNKRLYVTNTIIPSHMGVKDIFFSIIQVFPIIICIQSPQKEMMSIALESSLVILLVDFGPSSTRALKEKKKK